MSEAGMRSMDRGGAMLAAAAGLVLAAFTTAPDRPANGARAAGVPFDPAVGMLRMPATIRGEAVMVIVDTGLDPSGIGLDRSRALGLAIDDKAPIRLKGIGGEAIYGFATRIEGLAFAGEEVEPLAAMADPGPMFRSPRPDRRFDAVLGYNYLKSRRVLVDYVEGRFTVLPRAGGERAATAACRTRYDVPLNLNADKIPQVAGARFGPLGGAVQLDTGSAVPIVLHDAAHDPRVSKALVAGADQPVMGASGRASLRTVTMPFAVGIGPFAASGETALLAPDPKHAGYLANVGNRLLATLKVKMLLDYPGGKMSFFGNCTPTA